MISVSKSQLAQVEYLIGLAVQGNHILFEPELLKEVISSKDWKPYGLNAEIPMEEVQEIEHHMERIIVEPTLAGKRAYLEMLDKPTLHKVIKTYLNIIENNIYENNEVRH